jgi:hypothetical protein
MCKVFGVTRRQITRGLAHIPESLIGDEPVVCGEVPQYFHHLVRGDGAEHRDASDLQVSIECDVVSHMQ